MSFGGGFWRPGGGPAAASCPPRRSSVVSAGGTNRGREHYEARRRPPGPGVSPGPGPGGPLDAQRRSLPIHRHRRQILYAVERYPVVVIVGETGSGKSTQIPQYLRENGWTSSGFSVVCAQPRRVAAMTLAARVAEESGCAVGEGVGYSVRFDDRTVPSTEVRFVTDGALLREAALSDPLLSRYSVVMIDEAHERSLSTDALLGILRKVRRRRPELRVVICSATIDAEAFLNFFAPKKKRRERAEEAGGGVEAGTRSAGRKRRRRWGLAVEETAEDVDRPETLGGGGVRGDPANVVGPLKEEGTIISIDGRQHPVDALYSSEPVADFVKATVDTALRIHFEEGGAGGGDGDVLCFLTSGEDVDRAVSLAEETMPSLRDHYQSGGGSMRGGKNRRRRLLEVTFLPLYGSLPYSMQARVFSPRPRGDASRRIIFATNVAETSVTVPGVSTVVDCGFVKLPHFDPKTGFDRLIVCPASRANARQRAGRAGRLGPGRVYRLYSEAAMTKTMEACTPPEVLRTNLTSFVLTLKAMGVGNVLSFDLMSVPGVDALAHALESLYALGAIDDGAGLTARGDAMAEFPTEPRASRALLESIERRCAPEVLCAAAALQVRSLFLRPRTEKQRADFDLAVADFLDPGGDIGTCVNLMEANDRAPLGEEECRERFVNRVALRRAVEVRNQLRRFLRRFGEVGAAAAGEDVVDKSASVRKCIASGFFFNVAKLGNDGRYYTLRGGHMVCVSGESVLERPGSGGSSEYIIFCETYDGVRGGIEVRWCSKVQARWLRELAPHYWS